MSEGGRVPKSDFISTWTRAALRPEALYQGKKPERRRMPPLKFAIIVSAISALAAAILARGQGSSIVILVASPLIAVISVYSLAALLHVCLGISRGAKGTFQDTVTAVCYASAPLIFSFVPILGTIVGLLWSLVLLTSGLSHAQRVSASRAWVAALLGMAALVLNPFTLRAGVIEAFKIPSGAMIPTLMIGDHIFVEKLSYGPLIPFTSARLYAGRAPRYGEVIVFKWPEDTEKDFVKRIIASPGDTLEAINGRPIINGHLVPHCYVGQLQNENRISEMFVEHLGDRSYLTMFDANPDEKSCSSDQDCSAERLSCKAGLCGVYQGPFHASKEEVWVMGDNRNNSHDSRTWKSGRGAGVPLENIKGRATFVWMSFGPGGAIQNDRLFVSVNGTPTLPAGNGAIDVAIDRCLRERPPVAETTPSGR